MAHGYAMVTAGHRRSWCTSSSAPPTRSAASSTPPAQTCPSSSPPAERHHRAGLPRQPRPPHPLGPGVLRPGRDAARVREVGLRAANASPSSRPWSTAPSPLRQGAGGARVPVAAARGYRRRARGLRVWRAARAPKPPALRGGPGGDGGGCALARRRAPPHHHHQGGRPRPRRGASAPGLAEARAPPLFTTTSTST